MEADMSALILNEPVVASPIGFDRDLRAGRIRPACPFRRVEDKQFTMMEAAFLRTGGLASDNAVAHQLRRHTGQPVSVLAHWIVQRRIVCFPWNSGTLVPLFQFNTGNMTLCPGVSEILGELVDVFDDWEISHWFASPNSWLDDVAPVDMIAHDHPAVHDAARADRFIAHG
jgi:hypothetical protein